MAKPKAPRWLTEAFRDGVDERQWERVRLNLADSCWLAQHDPLRRPCSGRLERVHMIPRQRVERALDALLPTGGSVFLNGEAAILDHLDRRDVILLAAWDPRNAVLGCGGEHHPRFDSKQTPALVVPRSALPGHVEEFVADYGLETSAEERFPATA